jgi:hypothetical protein
MKTLKIKTSKTIWLMAGISMSLVGCSQQPTQTTTKTQASQILTDIQYKPVKGKKAKKLSTAQSDALGLIVGGANDDFKPLDDQGNPLWSEAYSRRGFNVFGRYLRDLATSASEKGSSVVASREFKDLNQDYACLYGYSQAGMAEENGYYDQYDSSSSDGEESASTEEDSINSNDEASSKWLKGKIPDLKPLEGKVRYVGKSAISLRKVVDRKNPNLESGAFQMSYEGSTSFKNCRQQDDDIQNGQEYWSKNSDAFNLYSETKFSLKNALEEQERLMPTKEDAQKALSEVVARSLDMETPDAETLAAMQAAKEALATITAEIDALKVSELTKKLADSKQAYIDLEINHLANLIHTTKRVDGSISYKGGIKINATADASKRVDYFELQENNDEMYGVLEPLAVALERVSGKIQGEWLTEGQAFSMGYNQTTKALEEFEFKFNKFAFAINLSVEQYQDILTYQTDPLMPVAKAQAEMKKILENSISCSGSLTINKETWNCEELTQALIDESLPTEDSDDE